MKYLTRQQIFDHAAKHLVRQKKRCESNNGFTGSCQLFGPRGGRCAIGSFLKPEDKALLKLNDDLGGGIATLLNGYGPILRMRGIDTSSKAALALLESLQQIHDEGDYANRFTELALLARRNGFTLPKSLEKALA